MHAVGTQVVYSCEQKDNAWSAGHFTVTLDTTAGSTSACCTASGQATATVVINPVPRVTVVPLNEPVVTCEPTDPVEVIFGVGSSDGADVTVPNHILTTKGRECALRPFQNKARKSPVKIVGDSTDGEWGSLGVLRFGCKPEYCMPQARVLSQPWCVRAPQ
jgi:hypothetical protein